MPQAPGFSRRGLVLLCLLASARTGFAAGSVELVSQANPRRLSDTAVGSAAYVEFPAPSISADGRWVAFLSTARNLVADQTEPPAKTGSDVFLHDRISGATVLVSHSLASPTATSARGAKSAVLSADGRWVAFVSESNDLVAGQPSGFLPPHLFLFDRVSGATTPVNPAAFLDANIGGASHEVAISQDGRYIAFISGAADLAPGQRDTNNQPDVFLWERTTAKTVLVSHVSGSATTAGNAGSQALSMSADGRFVVFGGGATDLAPGDGNSGNVHLYDRLSGDIRRIGPGGFPEISADGGTVLFFSADAHLAPGQIDTNGGVDAFLYDRAAGTTTLVSHAAGLPTTAANGQSAAPFGAASLLSADGRYVAFLSNAGNLVPGQVVRPGYPDLFLYDRVSGTVVLANRSGSSPTTPGTSQAEAPSISGDGRFVAFMSRASDQVPGQTDANDDEDVFLFDRNSGATTLVSAASGSPTTGDRHSYGPAISADGSQIAFQSEASNLQAGVTDLNHGPDVLLFDTASRSNAYVTLHAPDQPSLTSSLASALRGVSGDGRYVLFESADPNLVVGQIDTNNLIDVFLYDHATRSSLLVSRSAASPNATGSSQSFESVLSADGRYVAFASGASNLVAGVDDQTQYFDLFVFDRTTGSTTLVSRSAVTPGAVANRGSLSPSISADGRYVAFLSFATDLVPGLDDANGAGDVFLWDRVTGITTLVSRSSAGPLKTGNGLSTNPVVSADGRYVAYQSEAGDLVPGQTGPAGSLRNVFLYDRVAGTTTLVSHTRDGANDAAGIFKEDLPSLSADGRYTLFSSYRQDLADVPGQELCTYLFDRLSGNLALAGWTHSSGATRNPTLSADGHWAALVSNAEDLVTGFHNEAGGDQLYLYSQVSRALTLVTPSLLLSGQTSQGTAENPSLSADGRYLAFDSSATDLVPGQLGAGRGVFLYDRVSGARIVVSRSPASPVVSVGGSAPLVSADGRAVAFNSASSDLVAGDFNGQTDVFLYRADSTPPGPVTLPPCKLFDGALRSSIRKVLAAAGACGVPAGAKQVLVKVTASRSTGKGNVQFFPGNVTAPAAGILRFARGQTVGASFTLPLGSGGIALLPFVAGKGTVRVSVEVDGYTP